ncbi:MAG TPA: type II secretion system protein GspL [Spongiibacteraceae bacterium]|nr:type II secretion system protein GspL [Spongiibacteraceae bacterium]
MKKTVLLRVADDGQLSWTAPYAAAPLRGDAQTFAAETDARNDDLVLVLPAQKVLLQDVPFAAHERKLLRQTVPYSLEEQLIDDVDSQHFALGPAADAQVPVAIVDKQWLGGWLLRCKDAGLDIERVLPEQLLLPYREHCWTLHAEPDRWVVRVGPYRGFAMEPVDAALALQLLLDSAAELPQRLLVQTNTPIDLLLPQLPELLRGIVEPLSESDNAGDNNPIIDFLQGAFARTLPWRRWWLQWRFTAIVFAVAIVVHLGVGGVQHYRLNKQNIALRQQIEEMYRSVEPRGVVNDPELQLRRKLQALQGHQGGAVLPLLQQVGGALKSIDGIAVQNLTYSEHQGELRVSLSANAFKDVEAVRAAIANTGLNAQLVGSNTDGDKTRAQLRVTETK